MKYSYLFFLSFLMLSLNGQMSSEERRLNQEEGQESAELSEEEKPSTLYKRAPVEVHEFDEKEWQEATKDLPYTKVVKERKRQSPSSSSFEWGNALQFLALILLIVLLVFLLVYSLGKRGFHLSNKKIKPISVDFDLAQLEEELEVSNVQDFLRQAVAAQNYSLAVRLFYLDILKNMAGQQLIKWKRDKTNREYKLELGKHVLVESFEKVTYTFEQIWYGNRVINAREYQLIVPAFQDLLQKIKAL